MKVFWRLAVPAIVMLACSITTAWAEIRYISDQLVVSLREQPLDNAASITYLRTDAPVEILEEAGTYLKVRTRDGKTGFIKSNYLSQSTPKSTVIQQLEKERDRLAGKLVELEQQVSTSSSRSGQVESQVGDLQKQLNQSQADLARTRKDYQALQKSAKNVVAIATDRDRLQKTNQELSATVSRLEEDQAALMQTGAIKWFLAGGGILFLGWLLGKISRSNRRRTLL